MLAQVMRRIGVSRPRLQQVFIPKCEGLFNPLPKTCCLHPVRQKAFLFEILTNVRQVFWKTEGVDTARLPFFVGGGGRFIGSGF